MTQSANGPLAGVRILDLSRVLAGPFCTMILADLGAEVIKIEEPGSGDPTRTIPPFLNGESHYFLAINRNKKSVALDAGAAEGRELLLKLAARCDVILENFRPGVLDRIGLTDEKLKAVNPNLIVCSISGFGATGSMRDKPSFDLVTQALSGVMSVNGYAEGTPTKLGIPLGDIGGGLWAAIGVLAALNKRNTSGQGSRVDLSLLEGLMGLLGYIAQLQIVTGENPGRTGNNHHNIVPYGLMSVKDGHIVLALHVGGFWRNFCKCIGRGDLITDARFRTFKDRYDHRAELEGIIAEILMTRTAAEWHEILDIADVPHGTVNTISEALDQPVICERGFVREMQHPVAGRVRVVGSPLRFADGDDAAFSPPPLLGEHTRQVLENIAQIDSAEIERLIASGVVGTPEHRLQKKPGDKNNV